MTNITIKVSFFTVRRLRERIEYGEIITIANKKNIRTTFGW